MANIFDLTFDDDMGTYKILFNNYEDETEFFAQHRDELIDLWITFCEENKLEPDCVDEVYLEQDDVAILTEYLDRTCARIKSRGGMYWIESDIGQMRFHCWSDLINHMATQNEIARG